MKKVDQVLIGANVLPCGEQFEVIPNGAVAVEGEKIVAIGSTAEISDQFSALHVRDVRGRVVMPGFVDAHTHAVFAGSRHQELELKLAGKSYLDILAAGGGILSTVGATRAASESQLAKLLRGRSRAALRHGTTTMEVKSGYGLTTESELRSLRAIRSVAQNQPTDLVPTFMGAHAVPQEFATRVDDFVDLVIDEMIPAVAEEGLAKFCDVFCEQGVFDLEQSRRILDAGSAAGMAPKLHADEIVAIGGTGLAAEIGAVSADHLAQASDEHLAALASSSTIAVLLPGTTFSLMKHPYRPEAERLRKSGVELALATDFNPNCWTHSMPFMISLACYGHHLTPAEAILAATRGSARASGLDDRGSLEPGKLADLLVLDCKDHRELPYWTGMNPVRSVMKRGRWVV